LAFENKTGGNCDPEQGAASLDDTADIQSIPRERLISAGLLWEKAYASDYGAGE
jgi:hypothetical protein